MSAFFCRHPDDRGVDEIHFCDTKPDTYDEATATAFLRLNLAERYKTSGLSGDEWRFSTEMHLREKDEWVLTSSGYHDLSVHAAALYAELYGDFVDNDKPHCSWLYRRRVGAVVFSWKGLPVWSASYDGAATDLLVACGHLPWALMCATDDGMPTDDSLCCQPGCRNPEVSVYRMRRNYCRYCGGWKEPSFKDTGGMVRGFCRQHLRRGDGGLGDADRNYEVVSGPGPEGGEPAPHVVSKSSVVLIRPEGTT